MEHLPAFFLFMLVAGFTPGPNNLMLATSGVNFGLRRTCPHIIGVAIGFPILFFCVGAGLGRLFEAYPILHTLLKIGGTVYLVWLAWKIAFAPAVHAKAASRPLSFWQSVAFQWINPKGWIMTVSAITLYTVAGDDYLWQLTIMTLLALSISSTSASTWAALGATIRHWVEHRPRALRIFNIVMGVLLILSVVPILFSAPII